MNDKFSTKSLTGWWLFDFSNSIPATIGGIYFAKWFTVDSGGNSTLFNLLFFISSLVVILTGKWVGKRIDKDGYKFWIILSSIISIFSVGSIFCVSYLLEGKTAIIFSFIFFLLFLFGYQIGRICHNVYLRCIIPENLQSKMSGFGAAANWAGSLIGILITIPVILKYPGTLGRELTFLEATIAFAILVPISLRFMFRSNNIIQIENLPSRIDLNTWKQTISSIGLLLLSYMLLFDVMSTVQRNLAPYLTVVLLMADDTQSGGFLLILVSALIGGLLSSRLVRFDNSIKWLRLSSFGLFIALLLVVSNSVTLIWVGFAIAGLSYGLLESSIRINFMTYFSPKHAGNSFGVLAIVERTSGILGPLFWIIPFSFLGEKDSYITSMFLMALLTLTALFILLIRKNKSVVE